VGNGLTSLDLELDGCPIPSSFSSEASLPAVIGGARLDFDGDGVLDALDGDTVSSSCDEMVVLNSNAIAIPRGGKIQLLDNYLEVEALTDSAAVLSVWRSADLTPRRLQRTSLGVGTVILVGETAPVMRCRGATKSGHRAPGAWFAYLADVDVEDETAVLSWVAPLGAACRRHGIGANTPNRSAVGPVPERFYVDGTSTTWWPWALVPRVVAVHHPPHPLPKVRSPSSSTRCAAGIRVG